MKATGIAIAFLLCATTLSGHAAEPEQLALAEQVLVAMDMPGSLESSFAMARQSFTATVEHMKRASADADGAELVADQTSKMMEMMAAEMSWANVKGDYIALYAETYTADELKGLLKFYNSAAGQALVKKQPELLRRSMELGQKQMQRIMPKLQAIGAGMQRPAMELPSK